MQTAEKISITMTPEMMRVVRASVEAGEYASASEVFRDAIRVWQREREERAERLEVLRARARRSIDNPRPVVSPDEMDDRISARRAQTMTASERETA